MVFWQRGFLGNTLSAWTIALLITIGVLALLWMLKNVIIKRFYKFAQRSEADIDDLIAEVSQSTKFGLLVLLALYAGSLALSLPDWIVEWGRAIAVIAALIQVAVWGAVLIVAWLTRYRDEHVEGDAERVTTIRATSFLVRFVLFAIVVLLTLDNVPGVQVSTLIASLGITGIAVALAVQNILADLFASLSIALDKPFVIGDVIAVGDLIGTVEHIGLKTTRVRSIMARSWSSPTTICSAVESATTRPWSSGW